MRTPLIINKMTNEPSQNLLYVDLIAGWEFGANSGVIGADIKGVHNATGTNSVIRTTDNPSSIDTQSLTYTEAYSAYIQIPYHVNLRVDNTSFTIAALFRFGGIANTSGYQFIPLFAKDMFQSGLRSFILALERDSSANPSVFIQIFNNNSNNTFIQRFFNDSNWHLVIAEYEYVPIVSNTRLRLYFDNILFQETTPTFFISDNSYDYGLVTRFNTTSIPSSANAPWITINHNLQYIYRWNRLLTQPEKDYLWNNGNFRYLSA
jgi:hypothetical protein